MTLSNFLLARYAEDEAAAKAALGEPSYEHYGDTAAEESWVMAKSEGCAPEGYRFHRMFDPARVLADVEAKRRIVEHCAPGLGEGDYFAGQDFLYDQVLRLLALPYAGHPDFQDGWLP